MGVKCAVYDLESLVGSRNQGGLGSEVRRRKRKMPDVKNIISVLIWWQISAWS